MKITFLHEQVAIAIATGDKNQEEIAAFYGKDVSTLQRWNRDPAFIALVTTAKTTLRETILANSLGEGIAVVEERVVHLNERHKSLTSIIEKRSRKWQREADTWNLAQHPLSKATGQTKVDAVPEQKIAQPSRHEFTADDEGQGLETGLVTRKVKHTAYVK
jgi:hypothetical protein